MSLDPERADADGEGRAGVESDFSRWANDTTLFLSFGMQHGEGPVCYSDHSAVSGA